MKNKLIITIVFTVIASVLSYIFFTIYFPSFLQKINFENDVLAFADKNEEAVFSIKEITLFSSSDAKNKASSSTNFTIENLFAYTDIAIFIEQENQESSLENTLKEVSIDNIEVTSEPSLGQVHLYYKSVNDFAKSFIPESDSIQGSLKFETTGDEISDFSTPILYNNCASPITLSYVNENIKTDYTLLDIEKPITYNGALLKRCGVALSQIASEISFDVNITNYNDEKFRSKVFIPIKYQTDEASIYDGSITTKLNSNYVFYRYE